MKKHETRSKAEALREKAEELMKKKSVHSSLPISEVELLRLSHELEVHQLELELQEEELRNALAFAEIANDKYTGLYDFAPSGYFSLSREGEIVELNLA